MASLASAAASLSSLRNYKEVAQRCVLAYSVIAMERNGNPVPSSSSDEDDVAAQDAAKRQAAKKSKPKKKKEDKVVSFTVDDEEENAQCHCKV